MASDKSAQFAADTKQKELEHRLPARFEDERNGRADMPTQREFGGKYVAETPDEDLKMRMKAQFASTDGKPLGHTMISEKDYDYFLNKYKKERYLKALNFYDRIFDLTDPYQVHHIVKRVGRFQKHKKKHNK